jgi:serine/threonine protein kinase
MLGRYEIVAEIGRGAMGAVYKARDPRIDRFVAIKTVLLHQTVVHEQQEFRRRFFVEAQAAGRLLHPGIVAVFDVGEDPETSDPYIVMEYIEGHTLREVLASNNKKLPFDDALRITQELAEALDYAHTQGVVHRDIKPANILITKEGQAKISDFGIAQLDLSHMTLPGRVLGTPAYMSPEQLEGQQVDGRSDLFSLGAILYTVVTGYRPFQGSSATTVCFKVANHEPLQASSLAPELPHELDAIIARALAKNRAERYQRGMEFAADLKKLRERRPGRKQALWFSQPAAGRTSMEERSVREGSSSGRAAARGVPGTLVAAARKDRRPASVFSSWQIQTAIGIPLFVAAIVVSLFAWHEIRAPKQIRGSFVTNASAGRDVATTASSASSATETQSQTKGPQKDLTEGVGSQEPAFAAQAAAKNKATRSSTGTSGKGENRKRSASDLVKAVKPAMPVGPKTTAGSERLLSASSPDGKSSGAAMQPAIATAANAIADSNLSIHIENRFSDANLKVWIDDTLTYAHPLHDGRKKRLILLGGTSKETLTLPVVAGKHAVRIEVRSASEQYDETKTVEGEFLGGGERILSISFDKHSLDMRLALGNE